MLAKLRDLRTLPATKFWLPDTFNYSASLGAGGVGTRREFVLKKKMKFLRENPFGLGETPLLEKISKSPNFLTGCFFNW